MRNRQRGFITASALVATFGIVALIYFAFAANLHARSAERKEVEQLRWMNDVQRKLDAWYGRNKAVIDANPGTIPVATILSQSGIVLEHGARVESTPRLMQSGVAFHNIVVWIPVDGATGTGINQTTGEFNPGMLGGAAAKTKFAFANGLMIQTDAYLETIKRMRNIASRFEGYYETMIGSDPDSESTINYYRAGNCSSPRNGELACVDVYTDISSNPGGIQTEIGFSGDDSVDSWGGEIKMSNLEDVPAGSNAIALKTTAPWGSDIKITAARP